MMSDDENAAIGNRKRPNILVTGTPGVGKTTLAAAIVERLEKMQHLSPNDLIQQHQLWEGRDEALDTHILDEDALLDRLEPIVEQAAVDGDGVVIDFHVCEIFPLEWFDLVLVLTSQTEVLFDRLTARQYPDRKREENMECEIMQVVLEQARESYEPEMIQVLPSNSMDDLNSNLQRVEAWAKQWIADHAGNDDN